jgi:hypothetical protein
VKDEQERRGNRPQVNVLLRERTDVQNVGQPRECRDPVERRDADNATQEEVTRSGRRSEVVGGRVDHHEARDHEEQIHAGRAEHHPRHVVRLMQPGRQISDRQHRCGR